MLRYVWYGFCQPMLMIFLEKDRLRRLQFLSHLFACDWDVAAQLCEHE